MEVITKRITKAGLAKIKYSKEIYTPRREKDVILLPSEELSKTVKLNSDSSQYLFYTQGGDWFGGTDERPFLVEVDLDEFKKSENFYDYIKPKPIITLECLFGIERTKRQGDIFVYQLPETLQNFEKIEALAGIFSNNPKLTYCFYGDIELKSTIYLKHYNYIKKQSRIDGDVILRRKVKKPIELFYTRHLFEGLLLEMEYSDYYFGIGEIKAPDHQPLILNDICLLAQTEHLVKPSEAD